MKRPAAAQLRHIARAVFAPRRMLLICAAAALTLAVVLVWPMDTRAYLELSDSNELLDRDGRPLYVFLNSKEQWCFPRPMAEISPHLLHATVATEDKRFYSHPGVDPLAIVRAALTNLRGSKVVSGASTVTMQVVKRG
ncbi:MAG TPA: biosynthetic peptidoglycan transglycosylase, partial [Candidatus Hydrogenedentes bacterium]|nr:biosynthetic peptidoglycan transglycosylase [Candidatus Hydrogenedentota bacterium]